MYSNVASSGIDPELLESRINALSDPITRHWAFTLVKGSYDSFSKVQGINFDTLENSIRDEKSVKQLWEFSKQAMTNIWQEIEEFCLIMKPLVDAYERKNQSQTDDLSAFDELIYSAQRVDVELTKRLSENEVNNIHLDATILRIAETAWTMSFILNGEINAFQRRIQQLCKVKDPWEFVGALQDHLGHIRSAVHAILSGVFSSLPSVVGEERHRDQSFDLLVAKELRFRIFSLRDVFLQTEEILKNAPPHEWQESLQTALYEVECFTFGPGFAWMRASDKYTFLLQRKEFSEILELWSPLRAPPARLAVDKFTRFLEALEMLNQRECLIINDREALIRVVENMERALTQPKARQAIAIGLAAMSDAQGRDRLLDALLQRTMDPSKNAPIKEIIERAKEVLKELGLK